MSLPFQSLRPITAGSKPGSTTSGSALNPSNTKAVTSINNILHPVEKTTVFNRDSVRGTAQENKTYGGITQLMKKQTLNPSSTPPSSSPKTAPRMMVK